MRVLVCGGRDFSNSLLLVKALEKYPITHLAHGGAKGADHLAGRWAEAAGIPISVYAAQWDKYGKSAGIRRNFDMLKDFEPNMVVAFPGGTGTAHMVAIAEKAGVTVVKVTGFLSLKP